MSVDRNILAIDTAFAACSVAIAGREGLSVHRHEPMTKGHAERLFPMIREVMDEAALEFRDIDAVAVTIGPGSFTGVRVGIAAARGLALATGLPTLGATSLATLARIAARNGDMNETAGAAQSNVMVVQDARRGNVFVQEFDGQGRTAVSEARLLPSSDLATIVTLSANYRVTGSAANLLLESAPETASRATVIDIAESEPTAVALTEVDLVEMRPVRPLYLRPPDAKAQVGKSLVRQSK